MRLIDADALKEFIESACRPLCDDYHMKDYVLNQILTDIKNAPTVDAVEVKHGKWIPDKTGNSYWICTSGSKLEKENASDI